EMSNVKLPQEMVALLLGARAYEANQRVINAIDETMGRLIQNVGMPI
ncbi:MAG: flagellar basal body and hook protein, partial [Nitrospiraceae bacterium]|nr:flagellar basal body and hook protein [Nitrospiraceae bacterium]